MFLLVLMAACAVRFLDVRFDFLYRLLDCLHRLPTFRFDAPVPRCALPFPQVEIEHDIRFRRGAAGIDVAGVLLSVIVRTDTG